MQLLDARHDLLGLFQALRVLAGVFEVSRLADQVLQARQELVQRRVEEPDDHRQAGHRLEDAFEVAALNGQQLGELLLAVLRCGGHDHRLHDRQSILLHEHVLGAAQADALRAVVTRLDRIARVVGVGPHLEPAELVRPAEDGARGFVLVQRLGLDRGHLAHVNLAGRAVDGDLLALFDRRPVGGEHALAHVDIDRAGSDHTGPAHPTRDERRVAGGAAGLREDSLRFDHAMHVVGIGLHADQDHGLSLLAPLHRGVCVEDGAAAGRAG